MKIALLGYGKMGKVIEQIAMQRGHQIVLKTTRNTKDINLSDADVAIDFSIPSAAVTNISNCLNQNTPVISGTTGWLENYEDMVALCNQKKGAFIYGSNFSLGVNVFFELNKKLAKMMRKFNQYTVEMEEIHHTQKLDAPSGTAISLADILIKKIDRLTSWQNNESSKDEVLGISSKRIDPVPGTHSILYHSDIDEIELKHTAKSRAGFAKGAIFAAEWIYDKKGFYEFKDILFSKT